MSNVNKRFTKLGKKSLISRLTDNLNLHVPSGRISLAVLGLTRVSAGVFVPLGLFHVQGAIRVNPLTSKSVIFCY